GQLLLLYLLAAASVPKTADQSIPLNAESYEGNRRYFWLVFSAYQAVYAGFWIFFATRKGLPASDLMSRMFTPQGGATPLVIAIVRAVTRNRLARGAGLLLLIAWLFLGYWDSTISCPLRLARASPGPAGPAGPADEAPGLCAGVLAVLQHLHAVDEHVVDTR